MARAKKAAGGLKFKLRQVIEVLDRDGEEAAVKFAGRLSGAVLGDARDDVQRAASAKVRPDFYRQLGQNPEALYARGVLALRRLLGR